MSTYPPLDEVIAETIDWVQRRRRVSHVTFEPRITSSLPVSYHCNITIETCLDGAHRTEYVYSCSTACLQEAILKSRDQADSYLMAYLPLQEHMEKIVAERDAAKADLAEVAAERDKLKVAYELAKGGR